MSGHVLFLRHISMRPKSRYSGSLQEFLKQTTAADQLYFPSVLLTVPNKQAAFWKKKNENPGVWSISILFRLCVPRCANQQWQMSHPSCCLHRGRKTSLLLLIWETFRSHHMLLEASVRGRKVQSEKPSADRRQTWADVQPSPASDSRDRWDSPLLNAHGIFGCPEHHCKVNVTDPTRV